MTVVSENEVEQRVLYRFPFGVEMFIITPEEGDNAWVDDEAGRTCLTYVQGNWKSDEEIGGSET